MKLAVAITLDGLIRALRWNAHDLAEAVESGKPAAGEKPGLRAPGPKRKEDDEVTRR